MFGHCRFGQPAAFGTPAGIAILRERALREATQAGAIGVEGAHSIDSLT